jgi:hypothetical protein
MASILDDATSARKSPVMAARPAARRFVVAVDAGDTDQVLAPGTSPPLAATRSSTWR